MTESNRNDENKPRLPARVIDEEATPIIGFKKHEIPILLKAKLLSPLGKPAPNAVKYYSRATLEKLAQDPVWLAKATNAVYNHWAKQNARKRQKKGNPGSFEAAA